MRDNKIVLGTRGSELARAQARLVENAFRTALPALDLEVRVIATRGDKVNTLPNDKFDRRAGRKGIFTSEIEEALRAGEIDIAVHSAKDLPSDMPNDLQICAALPRAAVEDVLITKDARTFESLRANAVIGTGSVRRKHQLQWKRSELRTIDLRGNVPTRLRKFVESDWDAIVLARAGLERLGHDLSAGTLTFEGCFLNFELLDCADFLPAGGQGAIAMQVRREDKSTTKLAQAINHATTLMCLRAEREFLRLLQVDCNSPVGVLATMDGQLMTLRAEVFEKMGGEPKRGEVQSSVKEQESETISAALYAMMYGQG